MPATVLAQVRREDEPHHAGGVLRARLYLRTETTIARRADVRAVREP
ncbi:hypothetical protein [Streptomyces sp. IB2014 016-6]|nr:hypothetical protein [Streptomyces sp. IB2014 016-6]